MGVRALSMAVLACAGCHEVFGVAPVDAGAPDAGPPEACPPSYTEQLLGKWYRGSVDSRDWVYADADCRDDTPTGVTHLPVFSNVVELDMFREAVSASGDWTLPVGYGRDVGEGNDAFRAVTGEPLPEASPLWEPGEPTTTPQPTPETVVMVSKSRRLFDAPPDWILGPFPYVCQCDGVPATVTFDVD